MFEPLVQDTTKAQSESIDTILGRLKKRRVYIPDYQRDANQWNLRKQSLFIESILNNLTIPGFFFCEDDTRKYEVVDGQQRLNTLRSFANDEFSISDDKTIDYILPDAHLYIGKKYSELEDDLKDIFNDYPLTIIYLPKSIELQTKLEIFRRINEGGTPLSGQDIRLAYYSQSRSVTFIRLVGIHDNPTDTNEEVSEDDEPNSTTKPFQRMIELAQRQGLSNPWDKFDEAREPWYQWWHGKEKAKGQTPSLMFLWYLICLERQKLDDLLKRPNHLKMSFNGSTENALDIYCSQLQYQEDSKEERSPQILSNFQVISEEYFPLFVNWMKFILSRGLNGISVDKYKQLALFIAGAAELKISPQELSDTQWNHAGEFIRTPRNKAREILNEKNGYPEPKGQWTGEKGQKQQCDKVVEIVRLILNK
ncbi:hypothetical protein BJP34_06685 [Moorena producens PAL-8-15-08-1]|uniref:GmrSD restriction endonucleases N-terminal domain-containing protein n=1 Tax=Moorena producens PAL-8-15-08-1 TaxID=1458985 RepID=A0A1D8TNF9_9CYAN|nr:DUF262 domain-containing protein [Moorena producens]AOW99177.1 hypothetical protein BJP34_06685 [Moorena producens PAL-8-15-08-1]